jgi:tRNA (guanine9-N1)-methyltransferase
MAEIEERPSKVRKIERSEGSFKESLQAQMSSESPGQSDINNPEASQAKKIDEEQKPPLSKSQLKKLLKTQRWEAGKDYRREKRREKHKEKQARKAEQKAKGELPDAAKQEEIEAEKKRYKRAVQTPVALILDCDFDEYMTEKEIISLGAQVTRCYSENKKSSYRSHLAISSWGGRMKQRFETVLTRNHESWKGVTFHGDDFMAAAEKLNVIMQGPSGGTIAGALAGPDFKLQEAGKSMELSSTAQDDVKPNEEMVRPDERAALGELARALENPIPAPTNSSSKKRSHSETEETTAAETPLVPEPAPVELKPSSIIYLSSDSPDTLTDLEPNTSYIIGGIVDKNRHKGLCYKRACERGIRTAKLPIGDYMTMQGRSVLAINHVVEIMLKWLETGDWGEAFMSVIPKRKEAKLRINKEDQQSYGDEESEYDDGGDSKMEEDDGDEGDLKKQNDEDDDGD